MKNKKAILLKEGINLFVAVIVIVLLIILITQIFSIFSNKNKLEQAKATLNQIVSKIESLEDGEKSSYMVLSPKGWYIIAYEEGQEMPIQCGGKNCLCICEEADAKKCESLGVCKNAETLFHIEEITRFGGFGHLINAPKFYERNNPASGKTGLIIFIENYIEIDKVPLILYINKKAKVAELNSMESDTVLSKGFLERKVLFNGIVEMSMEQLIKYHLFKNCPKNEAGSWTSWKPFFNTNLEDLITSEYKKYILELISKKELVGGKIIFTSIDKNYFNNVLVISEGNTKSCYPVEEKRICSTKINDVRTIRGYVRFYACYEK